MKERIEKLSRMLEKTPQDPFLLYALGMEYKKGEKLEEAITYFDRTLAVDPGYCYAYHQKGLAYEAAGDLEAARAAYRAGIAAAKEKGDAHAAEEIGGALDLIE
jgi:tetratricopeptide (TPR) repeat protein